MCHNYFHIASVCIKNFGGVQGNKVAVKTWHQIIARGKIRFPNMEHSKFEGHVTPNNDKHQKLVQLKFRYCLGVS